MQIAQERFAQRRFSEAAQLACRVSESTPSNLAAWKLCGLSQQLSQQILQAEQTFQRAAAAFPQDAELRFFLARVQYLQGQLKAAEASAKQAIQLRADYADAHTQLAMTLDALHDDANALKHYQTAIQLNQRQHRAMTIPLVYASDLLVRLERYSEAFDYLTQAIAMNPTASAIRLNRGRVQEKLGKLAEAEKDYQQAIAMDGNTQARTALERLRASVKATPASTALQSVAPIKLRNAASEAKLDFTLRNGATPRKYQIETMTGGVAVIDYDNDGWQDIYFVNGAELPAMQKTSPQFWNRLYRNNCDGTFSDVTEKAGVKGEGYAMGAAVADYDNDGDSDLFIAGVNRNQLYRNEGNGKFTEVTKAANLLGVDAQRGKMWSVAAAWLDYDNDGKLDLFVVNYCKWHPDLDPYCGAMKEGYRTYCFPDRYEGLPNQLFHNNGDGTFTDVSTSIGIAKHIGKGMGISVADYNDDGFVDVFVANDTLPNFLFRNNGGKGFEEVGLNASVALNDSGKPVSSMGVDFRDYDNDGLPDLIVSALEGETFPLFRNVGKGFFSDVTWTSGLGKESIRRSGWSLGLFDFNNDGWKDLFTANAHVNDNQELYNEQTYRQSNSLFANLGNGNFKNVSSEVGATFQNKSAHRGAAFADFNHDGKIDVVTTSLNEPSELWLNEAANENRWIAVKLVGTKSNRDGLGARIKLTTNSGAVQFNHATTSVGYASASEQLIHFGLGKEQRIKTIEIFWPSGIRQKIEDVISNQILTIKEAEK
ncbi:MAG: VCBS repeat-containing protein [Blastocatellia bacterium]|nr:VCBS repeat-containing protein [Blastocatellia bacterium]